MKVCFVVSHPDDEVLWALPIICDYAKSNSVYILSLTHRDDQRGRDFIRVCEELKVTPLLADLEDKGWGFPLKFVEKTLRFFDCKYNFDLVITHPPHGNERPHTHHVESFVDCERYCLRRRIAFGFFSEVSYVGSQFNPDNIFDSYAYLLRMYGKKKFCNKLHFEFCQVNRKSMLWSLGVTFYESKFLSEQEKMVGLLSLYKSQVEGLREYKSFYQNNRYLVTYKW